MENIDPVAYVEQRLSQRRYAPSARAVARVVAERMIFRAGQWRTYQFRKRDIRGITGLHGETIQAATRALCSGPDPTFAFQQVMEHDASFGGMVRAWAYVLVLDGDSHAPLQANPNPADNTGAAGAGASPAPSAARP